MKITVTFNPVIIKCKFLTLDEAIFREIKITVTSNALR